MKVSRQEALQLTRRGIPVVATGGGNPPREVRKPAELPAEPAESYDGPPLEFNRLRDDRGNLTRAGMLHAIAQGGSVRHGGDLLSSADQVPDDDEIQATADTAAQAGLQRIQVQRAQLDQEEARLHGLANPARTRAAQREERLADDAAQSGEGRVVAAGQPSQPSQPGPENAGQPSPGTSATATPGPKAQPGRSKKE